MLQSDKIHIVGPLTGYIAEVEQFLLAQGYSRFSTNNRLGWTAQLSRWMLKYRISTSGLSEVGLAKFVRCRRQTAPNFSRGGLESTIQCLIKIGAIPKLKSLPTVPPNQIDLILKKFETYLREERAIRTSYYVTVIKRFLRHKFVSQKPRIKAITANDLIQFVLLESRRYSRGTVKISVTALRSYFHFLYVSGAIQQDLSGAIPAIAGWRMQGIPKGIEPQQLQLLLRAPNRLTCSGRRDFSVLLLLARLGLRRKEVASIELEDIDWRKGEIRIRGKGEKHEKLPLPPDIGKALANHLKTSKRRSHSRAIFLSYRMPFAPVSPEGITRIVSKAALKAGLPRMGAHCLRHTLATETLRQGGSLDEIAQVLRHASHDTTAIYAKVDLLALRAVTQAWPEVLS